MKHLIKLLPMLGSLGLAVICGAARVVTGDDVFSVGVFLYSASALVCEQILLSEGCK